MKYFVKSQLSENMHETPEGFLLCLNVPIARTGEMVYGPGETPLDHGEDGNILINREEEEVFKPETLASFEGKPLTIGHPSEFVSPENWARLAKGMIQNVRRGDGDNKESVMADVLVQDKDAINLVKAGLREVSCGYEAEYTQDGPGRGLQTNIIGNHLALVDKGRAGAAHAINDHKGKGSLKMTISDKIKSIFSKAQDEAIKAATDADKPDEKKDDAKDASAMDEVLKMVKDLSAKIDGMASAKDEGEKKDDDAKDADEPAAEGEASLEDRLSALEAAVSKLLENEADEDDGDDTGDDESSGKLVGDDASRVEILAPGLKAKAKDAKAAALKAAYATKEGKKVINSLTGGKAPAFDSAEKVNTLFIAASELLKVSRTEALAGAKQVRDSAEDKASGPMTTDKLNEINAKFWTKK